MGVRLGRGEALADILASSNQVAEGVATAGVVVTLARRFRVSLPVLTAVALARAPRARARARRPALRAAAAGGRRSACQGLNGDQCRTLWWLADRSQRFVLWPLWLLPNPVLLHPLVQVWFFD